MSDFKLRFTRQEQDRYWNRVEAIERRAQRLAYRAVWMPPPWTKKQERRAKLLCDLLQAFTFRRM